MAQKPGFYSNFPILIEIVKETRYEGEYPIALGPVGAIEKYLLKATA
ncbi:MAG: hypothetical protein AB4352_08265 [Hormoscilla sp.]